MPAEITIHAIAFGSAFSFIAAVLENCFNNTQSPHTMRGLTRPVYEPPSYRRAVRDRVHKRSIGVVTYRHTKVDHCYDLGMCASI
jgi:hypothetical protein